jgi:hypothetical protein
MVQVLLMNLGQHVTLLHCSGTSRYWMDGGENIRIVNQHQPHHYVLKHFANPLEFTLASSNYVTCQLLLATSCGWIDHLVCCSQQQYPSLMQYLSYNSSTCHLQVTDNV